MDTSKGNQYCDALISGISEEEIAAKECISLRNLYAIVDYTDARVSRNYLKHFCKGFINDICLCWPLNDEHVCNAAGYEPKCPLKNSVK